MMIKRSDIRWQVLFVVLSVSNAAESPKDLVVLDVDPGIDDAMAILTTLGDPSVSIEAITCSRGNAELDTVVVNLYKTLAVADRLEIPVFKGGNYGIVTSRSDNYFGKDGFGDLGAELQYNPKWASQVKKEHAASFLARIVSEKPEQIKILALGPLTNLALALELNPQFLKQARKVIILGGAIKGSGNVAPGIEFNFYADPEAARIVLDRAESSNTPVTLVPMETVINCDLGMKWRVETLSKINNKVISFIEKLDAKHRKMHPWAAKHYTPYDTYAAVALLNPTSIVRSQRLYGFVETSGNNTRGLLLVDYISLLNKYPNLEIVMDISKTQMHKTIIRNLSSSSSSMSAQKGRCIILLVMLILTKFTISSKGLNLKNC